ncbi:MAG: hypothetical protein KIT33_00390 [Candidatus Kapabacteria bacterium]|nr:hypothetical protein [Ignavibacteriota bacterium]MCW5883406.1 hypothetical protein [Candidatus Kapabacteria bacterium]
MNCLKALQEVSERESKLDSIPLSNIRIKGVNLTRNEIKVYDTVDFNSYNSSFFRAKGKINDWILVLANNILSSDRRVEGYLRNIQVINILKEAIGKDLSSFCQNVDFNLDIDIIKNEIYALTSSKFKRIEKMKVHNWILDNFQKKYNIESFYSTDFDYEDRPIAAYKMKNGKTFMMSYGLDTGWSKYIFGIMYDNNILSHGEWQHNFPINFLPQRIENCFQYAK